MDRRNQILLTSQSHDETISELPLEPIRPRKVEKRKKPSNCLSPKLSDQRGKAQNTKCQYQDWMPKE
jgi:hypothetical protein